MDKLFLVRDRVYAYYLNSCELRFFFLLLEQEKGFDRVDQSYLFQALEAFGVGREILLWLKMYSETCFTLQVGGGL